jgi:hypothetical protein
MKFQFAQSTREIEATKVTQFNVIQDNRSKVVTIIQYESKFGPREMSFLNGIEATLNTRGRYVQAKSAKGDCARILPDAPVETEATAETAEAANASDAADAA